MQTNGPPPPPPLWLQTLASLWLLMVGCFAAVAAVYCIILNPKILYVVGAFASVLITIAAVSVTRDP
jgi:hypothetical protein